MNRFHSVSARSQLPGFTEELAENGLRGQHWTFRGAVLLEVDSRRR